jgi:hypothetical protein
MSINFGFPILWARNNPTQPTPKIQFTLTYRW